MSVSQNCTNTMLQDFSCIIAQSVSLRYRNTILGVSHVIIGVSLIDIIQRTNVMGLQSILRFSTTNDTIYTFSSTQYCWIDTFDYTCACSKNVMFITRVDLTQEMIITLPQYRTVTR